MLHSHLLEKLNNRYFQILSFTECTKVVALSMLALFLDWEKTDIIFSVFSQQ